MSRYLLLVGAGLCTIGSVGCSEAVPPASEGAFVALFQSGTTTGNCGITNHNSQIGNVNVTEILDLRKEGVGGAQIFCTVNSAGTGFDVNAELRLQNTKLRLTVNGLPSTATEAEPHPGSLTIQTQQSITAFTSPQETPCDFWFGGQDQQVAAGRVWAQFSCPVIEDPGTGKVCALGVSTIALQNCDQ